MTVETLQLTFYDTLDTETRIVVQQRTVEIKALMKRAASDIIEIGQKLIEVKQRLGHGNFGAWLQMEFDWHANTAGNFMRVAEQFKNTNFVNLDVAPSALYLLAAPSTPESARIEALERAERGEVITHSTAREIVTDHRTHDGWPTDIPADWQPDTSEDNELETTTPVIAPAPAVAQRAQQFNVLVSSETNEWYTPAHILELARTVLGTIDLDPASCAEANATVKAESYCDQGIDGLAQPWHGRIWLNPPYGKTAGRSNQDIWAEKLITEYEEGRTEAALLLVKAALGYAWFERLWYSYPVCFVRERLYFTPGDGAEDGQAKAATAILYFGTDVARFKQVFRSIGRVILPED